MITLHYRADCIARWIRAAAAQAQGQWFEDRRPDYAAAVDELRRLAQASGRRELELGILGCVYGRRAKAKG